jgi:GntR family transcriptional regulator
LRYEDIEHWLRARVMDGRDGDALPSELDLAAQFGVSRMTARRAVQNLAAEGLVRRRRGSGTFIESKLFHPHAGPLMSFTEDMRRRGMTASSSLTSAQLREAAPAEAKALRLGARRPRVVSIDRLRLADATPMAIEQAALLPECALVLAEDLESNSLHESLRRLDRIPTVALTWISARNATADEVRYLQLPSRSPVLVERRIISDQHERPIEFTTTAYHPERYVIDAVFTSGTLLPAPASAGRDPHGASVS